MTAHGEQIRIELLGQFRVLVGDREIGVGDWPSRRSSELVALLALAEGRRLPRDHVIEHLWPHLAADAGAANLRKAAHHARRALGEPSAVVLRSGRVALYSDRDVVVDVERFMRDSERALRSEAPGALAGAAASCTGPLLPDAPYETWAQEPRRLVHARLSELLRRLGDWERLLEIEPTDEAACRELIRAAIEAGQRHVALRWYERLRIALVRELGTLPDPATQALHERCTAGARPAEQAFVGRAAELAEARERARAAATDGTGALVVSGPTGIGKSAFCRRALESAREDGWRVVSVTGATPGTPYGAVGAVVERVLVGGRASLESLPERTRSILAELTALAGPAPALRGAVTRHQVVAALRRALALPAVGAPTAIFVEDAHLLDEASADVLHQLVTAGAEHPLLVALACRSEWIRASLPRGVVELALGDRTTSLRLGPLDDDEIAQLVTLGAPVAPAPATAAQIARAAQGSPFFALELARAFADGSPDALPRTVREAVHASLAGLQRTTIDALTALAIAEDELDLDSVLALAGLTEDEAFAVLDDALDSGVLVVVGARYRFRHELVRQALIDDLAPHRRLQRHRDAARRLAASGAPAGLIARHWLKGERPTEAVVWLLAAARRAAGIGAFADARAQIERLLAEAPQHPEGLCLHAEILDALGDGRAPDAYAAAAVAVGDPEAQELRARQALAQLKASKPDSALRTLRGINPKTTAGRLAEALTLSAAAAIGRYASADVAAAKAQAAYDLAVQLGDPGAILDATWAQALAAHARGELPTRLRAYLHATHELPELATRVFDGQLCVTERMLYGGLPNDEIIAFADGLAAEAERIGAARGQAFAVTLRGEAGLLAGRLEEADADFATGARLHGQIGAIAGEALSLLGRAQVAIYRGRPRHAGPFLDAALVLARESEVGHHTLDRIYGTMVAAASDPRAGMEVIREAETAIQGPAETCPTCRIAFLVPATIAAARAGDLERARHYERHCATAIEQIALPPAWHAAVAEARGCVARADGRRHEARVLFRRAADDFLAWGQPLDARRCDASAAA